MKKTLLFSLALFSLSQIFAQKAVLVNGGQFGNPNEQVNVVLIDIPTLSYDTLDTIQTGSVQDVIIKNEQFFVLAQDSIVKYDAKNGKRLAGQSFPGPSTRRAILHDDELLVGNWFGKSTDNLYIFDAEDLQLLDSVSDVKSGVTSILIDSGFAYISQNQSNGSFQDTLGMVIKVDIATRSVIDSVSIPGYTQDLGELIRKPDGTGFYCINSVSNTIASIDFANLNASITNFGFNLSVNSRSQWDAYHDTLFLKMNEGIGAINLKDLSIVDSLIVDTIITAFTYDTLNKQFIITQSNFSGFTKGAIYSRAGLKSDVFITGISPEVIDIIPTQPVGISEFDNLKPSLHVNLYPNPSKGRIFIQVEEKNLNSLQYDLFNAKGQRLMQGNFNTRSSTIDLSGLERGFYWITILDEAKTTTKKIILN